MPEGVVSGTAYHRNKAGTISVLESGNPPVVLWMGVDQNAAHSKVEVPLDMIVSLQATPASSEKMMLRITTAKHKTMFSFNTRETMDAVKVALQQVIARRKSAKEIDSAAKAKAAENKEKPDAPTNVSNDELVANLLDSANLLKNLTLQQRLLRDSPKLMKTFTEAVIKSGLAPEEFWSSRVHLLRSYAIQQNQKRGPYNVLSTIKPVASSDNEVNVSVTREKIHEIFKQYPIVRKAYDDNVPKISEGDFWSRFFSSKLFRKLRGEKVKLYDRGDITLDKYLYYDPDYDGEEEDEDVDKLLEDNKRRGEQDEQIASSRKKVKLFRGEDEQISKCIDVAGNEEDDPDKLGNGPDITMKSSAKDSDLVNVLRTMNRLSRRMMANMKETKTDLDGEFKSDLEIKDLDEKENIEYNELKYTSRASMASSIVPKELVEQAVSQSGLNPNLNEYDSYIKTLKSSWAGDEKLDLTSVYSNQKQAVSDAYRDVTSTVRKNSKQSKQSWSNREESLTNEQKDAKSDISIGRLEDLRLTQSTSVEFLRHFWLHFNSIATSSMATNPHYKSELIQLKKCYFSIRKCVDRVNANLDKTQGEEKLAEQRVMKPLTESLTNALEVYQGAIFHRKQTTP